MQYSIKFQYKYDSVGQMIALIGKWILTANPDNPRPLYATITIGNQHSRVLHEYIPRHRSWKYIAVICCLALAHLVFFDSDANTMRVNLKKTGGKEREA